MWLLFALYNEPQKMKQSKLLDRLSHVFSSIFTESIILFKTERTSQQRVMTDKTPKFDKSKAVLSRVCVWEIRYRAHGPGETHPPYKLYLKRKLRHKL